MLGPLVAGAFALKQPFITWLGEAEVHFDVLSKVGIDESISRLGRLRGVGA